MPSNQEMIIAVAQAISDATGMKNIDYSALNGETRLTEAPFDLDSIDILEAVATIENMYKVRIMDAKDGAKHFKDLQSIVDFINKK